VTEAFRTADDRFVDLQGFPYEPIYRTIEDLRIAHVETGEGPPVVLLHGEPSWSYIWRDVVPPIRNAGYRCILPDHVGFGRSDKPLDPGWHSLERHVELTARLVEDLDLRDATLVVHDWGGPIGLNVALAHADRVARVVILDTVIDPREAWVSEVWVQFREFVEATSDFPVGEIMRATCFGDLDDEIAAAYDAPFPTIESKAALTGLPMSVPRPGAVDVAATEGFCTALRADARPMMAIWGKEDLILTLASGHRLASSIGRQIDHVVADAGHGIQEDQGPLVGRLVADWLASRP
jgi:haloalkane dehalogenase